LTSKTEVISSMSPGGGILAKEHRNWNGTNANGNYETILKQKKKHLKVWNHFCHISEANIHVDLLAAWLLILDFDFFFQNPRMSVRVTGHFEV